MTSISEGKLYFAHEKGFVFESCVGLKTLREQEMELEIAAVTNSWSPFAHNVSGCLPLYCGENMELYW